jgi:hypothetical protein
LEIKEKFCVYNPDEVFETSSGFKLLTSDFLIFVLMPAIQTTTSISRYTSDARAQSYTGEYNPGNPTTWGTCPLCGCSFDSSGNCCCGGVNGCGCQYCGATITCGSTCYCQYWNGGGCHCDNCGTDYDCYSYHDCNSYNGPCYCSTHGISYDCTSCPLCNNSGEGGGGGGTPGENTGLINFGEGINSETVSQITRNILQEVMSCAGITSLRITSTTRTPESQASAMYDNCENLGATNQKDLYANAGDQVIDAYSQGKAQNLSRDQIIQMMISKINEVGPTNVSKHCANPDVLNVIDISPSSISNQGAFENCLASNPGISNFIAPPTDPVFHIEIPQ